MLAKVILLLADVTAIVCLSRCLLQWAQLPFEHPLAQFCCQTTNWLVRPLRKAAPPLGRWDFACVLACILVYYLAFTFGVDNRTSRWVGHQSDGRKPVFYIIKPV